MKKKLLYLSLVLLLLVSACASAKSPQDVREEVTSNEAAEYYGYDSSIPMEAPAAMPEEAAYADDKTGQERMVIQTASLRVSVADPAQAMQATSALATRLGGYVVNSQRWTDSSGYERVSYEHTSISIRVPAEKLEEAMQDIREMSADGENGVLSESLSGQDVTSDFVDSSSRLRNLKAAEEQLMELMENTEDLEATMMVFRELTEIRSQIEVLEGHIKYLQESAALSSLSAEFVAEKSLQPIEIGGWKPEGVAKDALQTLVRTFQKVVDFLIRFSISCLPFLIPLGVGLYFLVRAINKSAAKRRAKKNQIDQLESEDYSEIKK